MDFEEFSGKSLVITKERHPIFILSRVLCLPDILYNNNVQFLIYRYDPSYIIKKAPRRGHSYILLDSEMNISYLLWFIGFIE